MENIKKKENIEKSSKKQLSDVPVFTMEEAAEQIAKSIYKSILKSIRRRNAKHTSKVVQDILDPNYIAEVDPDEVPSKKDKVLYKNKKADKCMKIKEKGTQKLQKFMKKKKKKSSKKMDSYAKTER